MRVMDQTEEFLEKLRGLYRGGTKLLLGTREGNKISPLAEVRNMATAGGAKFGVARIDWMNRRGDSSYHDVPDDAAIRAMSVEHGHPGAEWFEVEDCEHTVETVY